MATDTAMDTYKQGKKITGKADAMKVEAEEHLGQCKALTAAIADFAGSPVIGPVVFWVLHRIVALFTVAFFLYTLRAAVPTFSAKVTSADVEYLSEYQLPDIYYCLDGVSMKKFISKEKQSKQKQKCDEMGTAWSACEFEMMDGSTSQGFFNASGFTNGPVGNNVSGMGGTVMQFRSGASGDTRCGNFNMAFFNLKTDKEDEGECPVQDIKYGNNMITPGNKMITVLDDRLGFDAWLPYDNTAVPQDAPGYDDKAGFLAGLLPSATGEIINDDGETISVTVPAICFRNLIKVGAKSSYETNQDLALSMSARIFPPQTVAKWHAGVAWSVYFTEPGIPPYMERNKKWQVNATRLFVSAANTLTKMDLRPLMFKDETVGMSSYTLDFEQSTSYQSPVDIATWGDIDDELPVVSYMMFTFLHFARKVTIRYKTISEIWAEIGGLWAAATLVMAMVFSQSGTTDPKNKKPSVIFNFLPSKMRKRWIQENNVKLESAGAAAKDQTTEDPYPDGKDKV